MAVTEQSMAALRRANETRRQASLLRERLEAGEVRIQQVLMNDVVSGLPLSRVLRWTPGIGHMMMRRALMQAGIRRPEPLVREVSLSQLMRVAGYVEARHRSRERARAA